MAYFFDIYLSVRRTKHKSGIRDFSSAQTQTDVTNYRYCFLKSNRLPSSDLKSGARIYRIWVCFQNYYHWQKYIRFKGYFDVFFFRKIYFWSTWILAKIWEILFSFVNTYSASGNPRNIADSFKIDLIWKVKHIILEFFWPKTFWN